MATSTGNYNLIEIGAGLPPRNAATIASLTIANGIGDDTIADVGASFSQTTLNNNFRDVSDKIEEILALLQNVGIRN